MIQTNYHGSLKEEKKKGIEEKDLVYVKAIWPRIHTKRNTYIISSFFGIDGCTVKSVSELADMFLISRERIRQIICRFLRKKYWEMANRGEKS